MPQYYDFSNFPHDEFKDNEKQRSRSGGYLWEQTPAGSGFRVLFSEIRGEKKTKPTLPKRLRDKGIIYKSVKTPNSYLFYRTK